MSDFTERYLSIAEDCGFDHASPLDVSTLQVEAWVRDTCAEDKCHAYGHNWTCPPACGTLEECEAEMQKYEHGILLQVTGTQEKRIDVKCYAETEQRLRASVPTRNPAGSRTGPCPPWRPTASSSPASAKTTVSPTTTVRRPLRTRPVCYIKRAKPLRLRSF